MMDKPTGGEWKRVRHPETDEHRVVAVNNGKGAVIAVVGTQSCDDGIVAANANLMAASKDMADCLRRLGFANSAPGTDQECRAFVEAFYEVYPDIREAYGKATNQ
jgi:hypothetical protein